MTKIIEANDAALAFMASQNKNGAVVKTSRSEGGWEVCVEVMEESEFIKALKIPTVVQEKNLYELKLDDNLDVVSFQRVTR